jgi:hypothetical protein
MAVPTLTAISPTTGPTGGGDVVRLTGTGFAPQVAVLFGDAPAEVLVGPRGGRRVSSPTSARPPTPRGRRRHDAQPRRRAAPVPGEEATLAGAYRFLRPRIVAESDLTRLVRTLLRELKRQVIANVSMTVSVDYDDTTVDGMNVVAISKLPSLVLSGPRVAENRFFSTNEPHEDVVPARRAPSSCGAAPRTPWTSCSR